MKKHERKEKIMFAPWPLEEQYEWSHMRSPYPKPRHRQVINKKKYLRIVMEYCSCYDVVTGVIKVLNCQVCHGARMITRTKQAW